MCNCFTLKSYGKRRRRRIGGKKGDDLIEGSFSCAPEKRFRSKFKLKNFLEQQNFISHNLSLNFLVQFIHSSRVRMFMFLSPPCCHCSMKWKDEEKSFLALFYACLLLHARQFQHNISYQPLSVTAEK